MYASCYQQRAQQSPSQGLLQMISVAIFSIASFRVTGHKQIQQSSDWKIGYVIKEHLKIANKGHTLLGFNKESLLSPSQIKKGHYKLPSHIQPHRLVTNCMLNSLHARLPSPNYLELGLSWWPKGKKQPPYVRLWCSDDKLKWLFPERAGCFLHASSKYSPWRTLQTDRAFFSST